MTDSLAAGARPPIGIDYTAAVGHAPGVGRYARELVRALVRLPDADARPLVLVEVGRGPTPLEGAPLGLDGAPHPARVVRRRLRLPRRIISRMPGAGALISRGCRLFHRVAPESPPIGPTPFTLAVAEFPPAGTAGTAASRALSAAAQTAAGLFVFSADARERLVRDHGAPRDRVHQLPVGTEHWERALESPVPLRPTRDILVLGALRRARAPLDVLRGFEALRARGAHARLLLVGRPGDAAEAFRHALGASSVREHVRWIEEPDEARMPRCVGGSAVLLHLAADEATPVTPLEALRMGLPVVASPLPAFREALGDAGRWVDGGDAAAVGLALAGALEAGDDSTTRSALRDRAAPYTWRASAEAHARAWDSILAGRQNAPGS